MGYVCCLCRHYKIRALTVMKTLEKFKFKIQFPGTGNVVNQLFRLFGKVMDMFYQFA